MTQLTLNVPSKSEIIFDRTALLQLVDNDSSLLQELIAIFLSELPALLTDIEKAVLDGDAGNVQARAHLLKGSASTFNSRRTTAAAQVLEEMGKQGNLMNAGPALAELADALQELQKALCALSDEFSS